MIVRSQMRIALLSCICVASAGGCGEQSDSKPPATSRELDIEGLRPAVTKFCADCHAFPKPQTYTRREWWKEVSQGFQFYKESHRSDLKPPHVDQVIRWYEAQAPEVMPETESPDVSTDTPVRFRQERLSPNGLETRLAIADLNFTGGELLICDMQSGLLAKVQFEGQKTSPQMLAKLANPCHVEECDLDGDGKLEYLVADLGSFQPADHTDGKVLLLQPTSNTSPIQTSTVLLEGVGRVADVRCTDVTGDGLQDVLVAEFGWRNSGKLRLLVQKPGSGSGMSFEPRVLDNRHGTSHILPFDLDSDGDMDFLALISQEHETVAAFINQGNGDFVSQPIFQADDPNYGSSCIHLADVDNDQDMDVLFSNGDSLDSHTLKPCHQVQWLENKGNLQFEHHTIARLPGALGISSADFDADGDLDLVACTMTWQRHQNRATLVLLEQTEKGQFQWHTLEKSSDQHAVLETGDFDHDGDIDIAVGDFEERKLPSKTIGSVWWNEGRP